MSAELRGLIARELELLRRLVADHREVIEASCRSAPGLIEREAMGAMLHSFYTGVESILRSIAMSTPGGFKKGESWHAELLASMSAPAAGRPALLSPELSATLGAYLAFRHRFRNLYGFALDWERMRPLAEGMAGTFGEFERAVMLFLTRTPGTSD